MAPPTQEEFLKAWRELQLPGVPFDKEGYITDEAVKAWDYRQERDARLQQAKRDRPAAPAQAQALGYNIGGLPFQYPGPPPAPAALGVYDKPTKQWTGIEGPLLPRQRRLAMSGHQDPTPYTRMPTEEEMWGPEKIFTEYLPSAYQSFTEFLSQTGAAAGLASGTVGGVPVSAPDLMTIAPFSPLTEEAKEEIRGVGAEAPLSRARDVRLQQERAREAGVDVSGFGQAIAPMMAAAQPLWEGFEHWGKVTAPLEGFLTSTAIPENVPLVGGWSFLGAYEEDVRARYEQLRAMGLGHLEAYAAAYDQAVEAGDVGGLKQFLLSVGTDPIEFIPGVGLASGLTKAGLSGTRALARGATGMGTPALAKTTERLALDVARTRLTPAKVVVNVMDTSPNTTTRGKGRAQLNVKAKLDKMEKGEATAGDRTYLRTHTGLIDTQLDDLFAPAVSLLPQGKGLIDRAGLRGLWGTPSPAEARPLEQWAARDRFERLIDQVPGTTTVKSQGGKADAWGRTSEMMAQLLAGETRVPARSAFTTPLRKINEETWLKEIAKHTNRDVSEIKTLIDDTRAEFIGQAGKPQPLNPGVLDFRIWQSEGTMGRILKTPPGSKASHSLFVLYEGQVNQVDNELADLMRIARDRWTEQGGSYGKGFGAIVRGRWVPKSSKTAAGQEEIEILKTLFRALHDRTPENVNAIPSWLYDDFVDLVERTKGEEILRIDFNPKLAKVEDYFSRGWRFADNENGKLLKKANSKGMPLGTVKSYEKVRAGATFDEMLDAGFEPLYWNPYEVMVHSMKVSRRDRLQSQLIEDLMLNNVADVKVLKTVKDPITGELTGDVQIPAEPLRTRFRAGVVVGGETFMGFRVPKVGPAFEGRLRPPEAGGGITSQYALRNSLADRMENLFGAVPEWKIAGTDIMPAIRVATYLPKRAKLFGSWFQQRDFLQRNYGSTWSHMVDHLWHGATTLDPARIKAAALELAKWPESAGDILRSNFSPNYRKEIADWYLSTDEIIAGRPGINPSALVQSGLSTIDVTLLPTGIDNLAREVAQEAGYRLDKKMMRMVGDWESAMRQGLFEGVYPTAMKTDIINNIAPMYVRMAGHLTDDQLNGMIARAANIRYSTIPVSQSSIQWPWLRNFLKMFMFSLGESEGLIKQATKTMSGPDAAYWRKHWIGSYFSLLTTAEVIHWASTGEHLPVERWKPFEAVEDWDGPSWKTPLPFAYRRDFVSPDIPIKDRTGEQRLTLDLIGQMDTVLRMLSPADWVNSRRSVPVTAIAHQATGKDFYGRYIDTYGPSLGPIDGLVSRTAVLIHDLGVPIGVGQAGTQLIREALPEKVFGVDVEKLIPQEGGRLGLAGLAIKGTGFLPRSPVTKDMQNLMVEKAIENDPAGAESLRIQQGAEFKNLTDIQENFVKGSPVNEGLMAEMELRGEELSLGRGDDVSLWFEHRRKIKEESTNELRRIEAEAYGLEYEWVDEEGNAQTKKFEGKINPDKWYADTVKQLGVARNLANKLEEHRKKATVSKREKGYGLKEDFLEKDISPDRTPDKQLEDELYELLFGDNEELHQSAEYFGGEEYVPIESDLGEFNSFEYQRRIDKINEVAVRRGLVRPGEDYVEIHRRAVLQNRVDWGNLPQVEMDRLLDRDFIAKNYWRASTDERLLALLPSDEVRDAWKKYVTLPEKDRREKDDDSRDIASKKHKVGRYRLTFEELYGHSAIRDERIRLRRNSLADGVEGLEHKLLKWGYVEDPVQEATINELLRGGRARGQAAKSPWAP